MDGDGEPDGREAGASGPRVLVADDDAVTRRLAALVLERLGYAVDTVGDGAAAVAAAIRRAYDAVVMDCEMPVLDGYRAAAEIRRREGHRRHTPIVALTASGRPRDVERAVAAGMDAHLTKPVHRDELRDVLAAVLAAPAPVPAPGAAAQPPADDDGEPTIDLDEPPVLDPALLAALHAPKIDLGLYELVGMFLGEAPTRLERLHEAAASGDAAAVADAAHHLTGSAAAFGAVRAARRSRQVETAARDGRLPAPDVLDGVGSALHAATEQLAAAVSTRADAGPPGRG